MDMKNTQAAATYRLAQFESASPVKIVQMLNAGAIRFLRTALTCEPTEDEFRVQIRRAEDIIVELRASLNHEPDPKFSGDLEALYVFMTKELSRSVMEKNTKGIETTIELLTKLLSGWKEAGSIIDGGGTTSSSSGISHVS